MFKQRSQDSIYFICSEEGSFIPAAKLDKDLIKVMLKVALIDFEAVKDWMKNSTKDGKQWNAIYKLHYDVLHKLCEAFILFDKMKVKTHECLFVYICEKHPELEFNWYFFDKIRTKRNRSLYYGEALSYSEWKDIELQMDLYINSLKKSIEEKLK